MQSRRARSDTLNASQRTESQMAPSEMGSSLGLSHLDAPAPSTESHITSTLETTESNNEHPGIEPQPSPPLLPNDSPLSYDNQQELGWSQLERQLSPQPEDLRSISDDTDPGLEWSQPERHASLPSSELSVSQVSPDDEVNPGLGWSQSEETVSLPIILTESQTTIVDEDEDEDEDGGTGWYESEEQIITPLPTSTFQHFADSAADPELGWSQAESDVSALFPPSLSESQDRSEPSFGWSQFEGQSALQQAPPTNSLATADESSMSLGLSQMDLPSLSLPPPTQPLASTPRRATAGGLRPLRLVRNIVYATRLELTFEYLGNIELSLFRFCWPRSLARAFTGCSPSSSLCSDIHSALTNSGFRHVRLCQ